MTLVLILASVGGAGFIVGVGGLLEAIMNRVIHKEPLAATSVAFLIMAAFGASLVAVAAAR